MRNHTQDSKRCSVVVAESPPTVKGEVGRLEKQAAPAEDKHNLRCVLCGDSGKVFVCQESLDAHVRQKHAGMHKVEDMMPHWMVVGGLRGEDKEGVEKDEGNSNLGRERETYGPEADCKVCGVVFTNEFTYLDHMNEFKLKKNEGEEARTAGAKRQHRIFHPRN